MVNPFSATGYDLISSTAAINKVPDAARYIGFLNRFNLFREEPINTTSFQVEEMNGVLNLLTRQPRGGPAPKNQSGKRKLRNFSVPHYPLEDGIKPEEIQGVRAFGSDNQAETQAMVYARKLADLRRKHDLTREWLRFQALKGIVIDSDNSVIYNFFTEFGISRETQDYDLDDSSVNVNEKVRTTIDYIEDNLKGDSMTGVVFLCARNFYNTFIKHASVKEAFQYYSTTQQLSGDFRKAFEFAGAQFIPVGGSSTDPAGNSRKFIEDNYAYAVPLGTSETFLEVVAPADFLETVNTMGIPYYAKSEPMKYNRGLEVHTQMNILPVCTRPEVLVQVGMNID